MKLNEKQKTHIFIVFVIAVIQISLYNLRIIITVLTGDLVWTVERLTTTVEGFIIQIIDLALAINGFMLFLYIVATLFLLAKGKKPKLSYP